MILLPTGLGTHSALAFYHTVHSAQGRFAVANGRRIVPIINHGEVSEVDVEGCS